jgi:glucosamine-6-phosphate deaminase
MEVLIYPSAQAAADQAADRIAEALRRNPRLVLGLATGSTMEPVYARLVSLHHHTGLDFSGCRTFNLDEYVGLPANHPNSYRYYMDHHLFRQINIEAARTHLPDGMAPDLAEECVRYEALITQYGGIDLQLLGIGQNGHLGFNEPLSPLDSRTHVQLLSATTRAQNAPHFLPPAQTPAYALTMGMGSILAARRCLLLATGAEKAPVIAEALEGSRTNRIPASALQLHPHCTVILDQLAASRLRQPEIVVPPARIAAQTGVAAGVSPAVEGGILPPGKTGRPKTPYRAQGFSVR